MTIIGFQIRRPSRSELILALATLSIVAVVYTGLHHWLDIEPSVLRKSFFIFGTALILGPFGISPRQNGWRVLPIYLALSLFSISVL